MRRAAAELCLWRDLPLAAAGPVRCGALVKLPVARMHSGPPRSALSTLTLQITKAEEEMLGPDDELPIDLRVRGRDCMGLLKTAGG